MMNKHIEEQKRKGNLTEAYILHYIRNFIARKRYSPTFEEIREGVGLKSKHTVYQHMQALRDKGILDYIDKSPRTITLKEGA
jgi:SOS-response transcriptional repressor LexA